MLGPTGVRKAVDLFLHALDRLHELGHLVVLRQHDVELPPELGHQGLFLQILDFVLEFGHLLLKFERFAPLHRFHP